MTRIAGSGSGSISHRHGSADPDPYQNVTDPQHWTEPSSFERLDQDSVAKIALHENNINLLFFTFLEFFYQ
jgi:hypothetical protein